MSEAQFKLARQIEAARILREQIADIAGGDPDFIRDTIEGETELHECIAALAASIAQDEALAAGTDALRKDLAARQKRFEDRAELKRAMVASAMETGDIRKLETPAGTLSLRQAPPRPIVSDETEVPAAFWTPRDPKLDLRKLGDALKARAAALAEAERIEDAAARAAARARIEVEHPPVPGAVLSNGSTTLSIRSR